MKIQNIWAALLARFNKLFLINIKNREDYLELSHFNLPSNTFVPNFIALWVYFCVLFLKEHLNFILTEMLN